MSEPMNTKVDNEVWFHVASLQVEPSNVWLASTVDLYGCPRCGAVIFEKAERRDGYAVSIRYGRELHEQWHEEQVV